MTHQPRGSGFSTLAIHAGARPGAPTTPIFDAMDFLSNDANPASPSGSDTFGQVDRHDAHPTTTVLEERIAALEGGSAAVAVATGAAALVLAFHTLIQPGEELVAARRLGGAALPPLDGFGWRVKWADADKPESFVEALTDKTKAILIESVAQPGGSITDIEAIASVARRARVPLIVDNTHATPYLVRPFEHGADIIIHSATQLLAGNAGATGGIIVDGGVFDWLQDERYPSLSKPQPAYGAVPIGETFGNFAFAVACRDMAGRGLGPALSPFNAFLILNGIETLPLRMQRHCDTALAVAQHLSRHNAVTSVRYPGLDHDPSRDLARRYCHHGAGTVVTFSLAGGHEAAAAGVKRLRLFANCSSVGNTRSFVDHQNDGALRLSIGLEDADDIIADLDQALA